MNEADYVHKFEAAGLGKAPFRLVGHMEKVYIACPGAPEQPGGTCDYCGSGIRDCFIIRSADGKEFMVGSSCVNKTAGTRPSDKDLVNEVKKAENKIKREARQAKEKAFIADNLESVKAFIAASEGPHPNAYYASQGKTLKDYREFMWNNCGRTGAVKLIKEWLK